MSGQDRSSGWFSSSSSPPPWTTTWSTSRILTGSFPSVRQRQPQREHDREQGKVGDRLGAGVQGDGEIEGLGLHLLQLGGGPTALHLRILKHRQCVRQGKATQKLKICFRFCVVFPHAKGKRGYNKKVNSYKITIPMILWKHSYLEWLNTLTVH